MLKLLERTLVNRAYELIRTLLFPARAETVESTSSTVEDGGRGLDVNQSLSQPTKYIPLTVNKAPELTKLQAALYVGVRYTWPLELALETELRWKNHLFCCKLKACAGQLVTLFERSTGRRRA